VPEARPAFLFDGALCTGCEACRVACGNANRGGEDTGWRRIHTLNPRRHPALPTAHLSLACNHCDTPACLLGCPAAAYRRDEATGAVLLDEERCIGCRYCSWLCPYDAPRYEADRGVMGKCTFCVDRLAGGGQPACTAACPTGALRLGPRPVPPEEPRHPALPGTGLGPSLVVAPPRPTGPTVVAPAPAVSAPVLQPPPEPRIHPFAEWPLAIFTVALPLLVGWFAAGLLAPARLPHPLAFLGLGGATMALSAVHLGRPLRAWRAVANLRHSWLSREVLLAGLFVAVGAVTLAPGDGAPGWAPATATAIGVAALFAVDRVYAAVPTARPRPLPHSGGALLSGAFLATVVAGLGAAAVPLAGARTALFLLRGPELPRRAAALRLALLFAAAAAPWVRQVGWEIALGLAAAGEAIDRFAFYAELEPVSPGSALALAAAVSH